MIEQTAAVRTGQLAVRHLAKPVLARTAIVVPHPFAKEDEKDGAPADFRGEEDRRSLGSARDDKVRARS